MKNVLLCYRLQVFDSEILPNIIKYKDDNIYLVVQNKTELNFIFGLFELSSELKNCKINISTITVKELLDGELNRMKGQFDYIVGNPPYQGSGDDSSNKIFNKISAISIELLKPNGVISFITPTAILSPGQKNKKLGLDKYFKKNLVSVDFSADNHFQIGQTVCRWTIKKNADQNCIHITYKDGTVETVSDLSACVDVENKVAQVITNKIIYEYSTNPTHIKMPIGQSNQARCAKNIVDKKDDKHTIEVYCNTKTQRIKYCSPSDVRKEKYNRLIIEYSGDWKEKPFISDMEVNALMFVSTKKMSDEYLENMKSILISKLYSFAIEYDKTSGLKSSGLYNLLFKLTSPPLNKSWTDEELYKEFNITEEEQKVIEEWYKKWKN